MREVLQSIGVSKGVKCSHFITNVFSVRVGLAIMEASVADSVSNARGMIMEKLQESDTEAHRWVEQTDGGITTYILEQTEDARIKDSRIEFYQEPSLFGFGDNR